MTDHHNGRASGRGTDDFGRLSGVAALMGGVAALVAGATFWLMLMEPVSVAIAVETGDVTPLVQELASALYTALLRLLEYL